MEWIYEEQQQQQQQKKGNHNKLTFWPPTASPHVLNATNGDRLHGISWYQWHGISLAIFMEIYQRRLWSMLQSIALGNVSDNCGWRCNLQECTQLAPLQFRQISQDDRVGSGSSRPRSRDPEKIIHSFDRLGGILRESSKNPSVLANQRELSRILQESWESCDSGNRWSFMDSKHPPPPSFLELKKNPKQSVKIHKFKWAQRLPNTNPEKNPEKNPREEVQERGSG